MSLFNGQLARVITQTLGDSIREPFLMDLGDPITGDVDIELSRAEHPGLVWVHARRGENQTISGQPGLSDEDKETATRALITPNKIPDDLRIYGAPVYVVQRAGVLTVFDLGGMAAVEYFANFKNHNQRSVDISQFDYGLIRPTAPPGKTVIISPFRATLDGIAYDIPPLQTGDLIDAYGFVATQGEARAVKIEVDPKTNTLYYQGTSPFTDNTHPLAFPNYPHTITAGRFLLGWVKMVKDMTRITVNDIYPAQEIYSKDSISGYEVLNSVVTVAGLPVISDGKLVWSTP